MRNKYGYLLAASLLLTASAALAAPTGQGTAPLFVLEAAHQESGTCPLVLHISGSESFAHAS